MLIMCFDTLGTLLIGITIIWWLLNEYITSKIVQVQNELAKCIGHNYFLLAIKLKYLR